jgi:hypothetical protein
MSGLVYEVHVVGVLSETVLSRIHAEVGNVHSSTEPATTVISGKVADQSALVGLLDLIHALGLEVCELRHVSEPEAQTGANDSAGP